MKYLYGASGHAKVIVDIIRSNSGEREIQGIFDDSEEKKSFLNIPFLGKYDNVSHAEKGLILISIGNNEVRKKIASKIVSHFFTKFTRAIGYKNIW